MYALLMVTMIINIHTEYNNIIMTHDIVCACAYGIKVRE